MIKTGWWWGRVKAVAICIPLMPKDVEYFVFLMLVCYLCFSSWELSSVLQFMFSLRCSFSRCLVFEIVCLLVSCQMYSWWGCSPILWAVSSIQCFLCFTVSWGLIWWPSVLFPKWLDFCSYYLGYKWLLLTISAHQSQSGEQWIISQWEKKESLSSYLYKIINEKKGIFECQLINVQRMI